MAFNADLLGQVASRAEVSVQCAANVLQLVSEGCTVPFIARYRKERTGGLDEVGVKRIIDEATALEALAKRKAFVTDAIRDAGGLTDELQQKIAECFDAARLEDLYLPFKPKRKTRAAAARERGLEPLAKLVMAQRSTSIIAEAKRFVKKGVASEEEAISGACDIIAEWVSENEHARAGVRRSMQRKGVIRGKGKNSTGKYADYNDYSRPLRNVPAHACLALRRAESEGELKISVEADTKGDIEALERRYIKNSTSGDMRKVISSAVTDGYKRLLLPSITNEALAELKSRSDVQSIALFADALRQILLYPPVYPQPVLALDPGFRTGCKVACLDQHGQLLEHAVIYPAGPTAKIDEAARMVKLLLAKYSCKLIALGDGTASRETERFLQQAGLPDDVRIERVSEQGASIYSASDVARREFPDLDLTIRSAVSIGRRLQDPLSELVKIDPKSIGVGQYQHDVDQARLKDALDFTVERCVNEVGVNLNTASPELLAYVAGIGPALASNIVAYRNVNGEFRCRKDLMKVPRLGTKAFEQASGFLRVPGGDNPLDNSAVHPESYHVVQRMAKDMGCSVASLIGNDKVIDSIDPDRYVTETVGRATIDDILAELRKPGRDPREAVEADWRDCTIESIDDVSEGMVLQGKVVNLTAFGAFVDLGIKQNGLIHISEMSHRRIQSPAEVLSMWQIVTVKVIGVDHDRGRISLTMKNV